MLPCFPFCLLPSSLFVCLLFLPVGHFCPAVCSCMDYHTIDCRDQGLPSVPSSFPLDVRKLLIADNNIQVIPADFFIFYGDLVYLDFRNNSLTSLEEGTFSRSTKLLYLDLSYNNLTQLDAGIFKSAEKLVKLSLGNNNLVDVDEAAFENLEQLQVLELNDNNLQSLNVAILEALPSLRTIRLEGNPWVCDCDFASLFSWIQDNASKLQKGYLEYFHLEGVRRAFEDGIEIVPRLTVCTPGYSPEQPFINKFYTNLKKQVCMETLTVSELFQNETQAERVRKPRCCRGPQGLLPRYSESQAEGQEQLFKLTDNIQDELFIAVENIDSYCVLISSKAVYFLKSGDYTDREAIFLEVKYDDLYHCLVSKDHGNVYIQLTKKAVNTSSGVAMPGPSQQKPMVNVKSEVLAVKLSQEINYAKSLYYEQQLMLRLSENQDQLELDS